MEENCKGCSVPMWTEGKIDDDIPLCHACYQDEALRIRWTGEGECDKCASSYDLSSRDNRCGDCGNCSTCCTHEREGK
jgi:hypothetical protein